MSLSPRNRRIVQAVLYETFAIACVAPMLMLVFGQSPMSSLGLSVTMSSIALVWNYTFNFLFERWESGQAIKGRSWRRRAAHGLGFEGGLALILVPVMAGWLGITWWQAFVADLGILLFFLVYTVVFTWVFDRVFGLPQSAQAAQEPGTV
ncbi:MAG: PACE efflux transporter [Hydrogenophaga sp.]|uniref:PACE efflux transporter n=1 Tax=Hydrogenophaga sp. TaxID=1904254 RepID=UPI0027448226|nr:PACE efflux transporter [Hydrogenophaga sp.]MDP2417994.1 PACE efflux transporter [Hydrogenophaga sp.]MDZ4188384.1 PACE efflux transporter [Hydrogenophaga sp.]